MAPRLSPELQAVLSHALQQSFRGGAMGAQLSSQLSAAVVDSLLDLSRSTGKRLSQPDNRQVELLLRFADRFLDELGGALPQDSPLNSMISLARAINCGNPSLFQIGAPSLSVS